jgi:hypothetical protein
MLLIRMWVSRLSQMCVHIIIIIIIIIIITAKRRGLVLSTPASYLGGP